MAGDEHEDKRAADPATASPGSGAMPGATSGASADAAATPTPVTEEPKPTSALSEWTASDARGRLNEVGSVPRKENTTDEPQPTTSGLAGSPTAPLVEESSASNSVAPAATPRASLWPVAAGIVVGALLGAGSAYFVYARAAEGGGLDARIAASEKREDALKSQVDALNRRPDPQPQLATLKTSVEDLAGKLAALEKQPVAAPNAPAAVQPQVAPAADTTDLQQKVAALQASIAAVKGQAAPAGDLAAVQSKLTALSASVGEMQRQAGAARTDVQALQTGQKSLEGKVSSSPALAVVADSLIQQIRRGQPFATQVKALEALGVDPVKIAILRQFADAGVPTAVALATRFEPLTEGLVAAGRKLPADAGLWDRLKTGASGLVSIRRVDAVSGDDLPSRVARIKADLERNDVVDAVNTWTALPAEARARPDAAAWGALAKTHADAITAAGALEHDAIAALAAKKS